MHSAAHAESQAPCRLDPEAAGDVGAAAGQKGADSASSALRTSGGSSSRDLMRLNCQTTAGGLGILALQSPRVWAAGGAPRAAPLRAWGSARPLPAIFYATIMRPQPLERTRRPVTARLSPRPIDGNPGARERRQEQRTRDTARRCSARPAGGGGSPTRVRAGRGRLRAASRRAR